MLIPESLERWIMFWSPYAFAVYPARFQMPGTSKTFLVIIPMMHCFTAKILSRDKFQAIS